MNPLWLFFKPTVLKGMLAGALATAALLLHLLTLSPFEGSAREGTVSFGTKTMRGVGRRLIFTGIYRDVRRSLDRYFQPTGEWQANAGFTENPTWGARLLKNHFPNVSFTRPGQAAGALLGVVYFYSLACVAVRLGGR